MNPASFDEPPSKSQRKRECDDLQKTGERLLALKPDELALIDLPADLADALQQAKQIKSHGALKRQRQYLGKLLRVVDSEAIEKQLNAVVHRNDLNNARFRKIEKWRDRLLEHDGAVLDEIIAAHADIDRQHINNLVRKADRESSQGKPPTAARKLFSYLREVDAVTGMPPELVGRDREINQE
jgi:ribosome-associated protein